VKFYFPTESKYKSIPRKYFSEWIKPIFPEEHQKKYKLAKEDIEFCKNIDNADALVMPLTWNYYFENEVVNEAMSLIDKYNKYNKPIYTWSIGDELYKVPEGNFFLFRQNGYQSTRRKNEYSYPVIIRDPMDYLKINKLIILDKEEKPRIGFCGLADKNWIHLLYRKTKVSFRKLINSNKKSFLDYSKPISGTELRMDALNQLSNSNGINTEFIIRNFSGGQSVNTDDYKMEFWENILASPYTLCIRGTGNYSARLYETLALGRIPVFINTDCILPFDEEINWKEHCIWIEKHDIDQMIDRIIEFHANISNTQLKEMQISNRKLWVDKLTYHGFHKNFTMNVKKKIS